MRASAVYVQVNTLVLRLGNEAMRYCDLAMVGEDFNRYAVDQHTQAQVS